MISKVWYALCAGILTGLVCLACSADAGDAGDAGDGTALTPPMRINLGAAEGRVQPVELTRIAEEHRRLREEHDSLIDSLPTPVTPVIEEMPTARERQQIAIQRVTALRLGEEISNDGIWEDWFDPTQGISFYRDQGGDWTSARLRREHPYRDLFYYEDYPDRVRNFEDETIYGQLARELSFAAHEIMPVIGEPNPALVDTITANLGWEIRDAELAVVNVWSSFRLTPPGSPTQDFAVGGVMRLGVREGGAGDGAYHYLVPGSWVGSVVVERLE